MNGLEGVDEAMGCSLEGTWLILKAIKDAMNADPACFCEISCD